VRSAGGDKSILKGRNKEDRELSDQRILGSGEFVGALRQQAERLFEKKYQPKRNIEELVKEVAVRLEVSPELICSKNRQRKYSEARALVAYLAVEETGHTAADVARFLGVRRMSVHEAVTKGKEVCHRVCSSTRRGT